MAKRSDPSPERAEGARSGFTEDPIDDDRTAMAAAYHAYWRFNVRVIAILLGIGAIVSFGVPLFAESLQRIHFAGWSLPFYVGAQGATIVYLALVGIYIAAMTWADRRLRHGVRQSRPVASSPSTQSHRRRAGRPRQD